MPVGPGKYDDLCTHVRQAADAACAVVLVIQGKRGSGFSVQSHGAEVPPRVLADMLRSMAEQIEQSSPVKS